MLKVTMLRDITDKSEDNSQRELVSETSSITFSTDLGDVVKLPTNLGEK